MSLKPEVLRAVITCGSGKKDRPMHKLFIAAICVGSLAAGSTAVEAKGCIKGAIVGGVAGHYAGHHGFLGAAAGCLAGRHLAKQHANAPVTNETPAR